MMRALLIMTLAVTSLSMTAGDASAQWRSRGYGYGRTGWGVTPYWGVGVYGGSYYPHYGYYAAPYYGYTYSPYAYSASGYDSLPAYASNAPYTTTSGYTPQSGIAQAGDSTTSDSQFKAHLTVLLPTADADVWLGSKRTTAQGMERRFESPVLEPNKEYSYTVKARWMNNGKLVEQTREVTVQAGKQSMVNFREPQMEKIPAPEKK